jgi:cell division protein FtsL
MTDNNGTQPQQESVSPAQQVRSDWRALMEKMSYRAIIHNIPFLSFLALLCMIYISNNHKSIEIQRQISKKNKELEQLHWRYGDTKSSLMQQKTEMQVRKNATSIGLEPPLLPAYKVNKQ